ncbi:NADP-dependent oxidoreductase domain-containing protein [Thelephora terrestris]|uniref:NADP-dependent oxidoreductase domain-containing protein n=1 Tax=Thelephora terrestris TaxID=56493 RepID=A0A9P6H7E1_9AGAM|nr:NADP-dependent oxidoreductase domain-containing protein [Thelephora terrestris]
MSSTKPLKYVRLGNSGLKVSQIILGCMTYGDPNCRPWMLGEKETLEHVRYAFDSGINTFDTANAYSNGESERLLGKALKHHKIPREEVVILTKVLFPVRRDGGHIGMSDPDALGYVNQHGLSRKHIFDSIKASLQRLDIEYVDLLQCHRFDPNTPIEETMRALHDVVQAGYARYIGMSSCWAWQFYAMQSYAIQNNLTPFISMQNQYNLIYREEEREMIPLLKHLGVGCIPWAPLARGALARPWDDKSVRSDCDNRVTRGRDAPGSKTIVERVEELAKKKSVKMAQIAIAWSVKKATAPIVGTTKLENIKDAIEAVNIELTDEEIKYLEETYQPRAVIGHT